MSLRSPSGWSTYSVRITVGHQSMAGHAQKLLDQFLRIRIFTPRCFYYAFCTILALSSDCSLIHQLILIFAQLFYLIFNHLQVKLPSIYFCFFIEPIIAFCVSSILLSCSFHSALGIPDLAFRCLRVWIRSLCLLAFVPHFAVESLEVTAG